MMIFISSPIFVWLFLTAWLWAGAIASALYNWGKNRTNSTALVRGAMVIFAFIAIQSAFWFVACGFAHVFIWDVSFAEAFRWLFSGSQGSVVFWIASLIGLLSGLVFEVKDALSTGTDDFIGPTMAIAITIGLVIIYWIFLLFQGLVSAIVVIP